MTSIGSPPNALSAPSAALTTPACEHDESTLTHARRKESLVEDQGIRHGVPVAHRVVSDEPRLVRRHALNLAADEEEARKCVCLGVLCDAPTGALERLERRFRVQQHQHTGRGHGATLVGPVWV
jgi:hypothetical protein